MKTNLKAMVEAIGEIKAQHYCGSQEAYNYLKEKRKYYDLAFKINEVLRKEFPNAQLPRAIQLEELELLVYTILPEYFSFKYSDLSFDDLYEQNKKYLDMVTGDTKLWFQKNFSDFALEYYRSILSYGEIPPQFTKQLIFIETCERFLGSLDYRIKEVVQEQLDSIEEAPNPQEDFEAIRYREHFNNRILYKRMITDHLLNKYEYQRLLIADWLVDFHFLEYPIFCYLSGEFREFPQTFKELVISQKINLEIKRSMLQEEDNKEREEVIEFENYIYKILPHHISFVKKLLGDIAKK